MELIDNKRTYCINYSGIYIAFSKNRKFKIDNDKIYFFFVQNVNNLKN